MVNYKGVSTVFIILTVVFGAATGYFLAFPPSTRVSTTVVSTVATGVPSFSVSIAYKSGIGYYLANGTGYTLYFRSTDTPNSGTTTCTTSTCEKSWPVFYVPNITLSPGLNSSAFGTITAYNSTKIVTYDGYALFYWIGDSKSGDTLGQGVGNFYVATVPAPAVPTSTATTDTVTTSSTSTSTSSPYGY